ncbi:MAG: hypothetical protein LBC42_03830 [Puniceicoccales bacterium]|jgi:hypothetical protein|nr:hypothetical protein [Puniceicoccales bacterium]
MVASLFGECRRRTSNASYAVETFTQYEEGQQTNETIARYLQTYNVSCYALNIETLQLQSPCAYGLLALMEKNPNLVFPELIGGNKEFYTSLLNGNAFQVVKACVKFAQQYHRIVKELLDSGERAKAAAGAHFLTQFIQIIFEKSDPEKTGKMFMASPWTTEEGGKLKANLASVQQKAQDVIAAAESLAPQPEPPPAAVAAAAPQ